MADIKSSVQQALKIDGCIGAAVVDYESGMCLGTAGNPGFDLELAAAGNTEVVRAKKKIRDKLGLRDRIEDILITLTAQYHLIRMVGSTTFIYVVLDRAKSNLALAQGTRDHRKGHGRRPALTSRRDRPDGDLRS